MNKTLLCILDGVGLNPNPTANAVAQAETPCLDRLLATCPNATLITCGERVGLPEGQMGNSEVGHLNIGAGRVVEQWLLRINRALAGPFLPNAVEYRTFLEDSRNASAVHLIGLFSDGGVHSHSDHLDLLLQRLHADFNGTITLHLITDGRDTAPDRARGQVEELMGRLASDFPRCRVATLSGRFWAMDRDKRWERTWKAFEAIVLGEGHREEDTPGGWIQRSYDSGVTDEFIEPAVFGDYKGVQHGDGVIFWNFRADRMRQIVRALCLEEFDGFARESVPFPPARALAFTEYDETFPLPFLFSALEVRNHLGEVVSQNGLRQLRVAETEKYPHVTYFFNGLFEPPLPGEDRHLLPSPRDVKTYDEKPEMSAEPVTDVVVEAIRGDQYHFLVINFANGDMVGHTGVLPAAIRAVETADRCLQRILDALAEKGWSAVIIADHGNAEQMINYEDGTPHTAHTLYPVPIILVGVEAAGVASGGALCDVAPTVLQIMGLPQPEEMTGTSLLKPPSPQ